MHRGWKNPLTNKGKEVTNANEERKAFAKEKGDYGLNKLSLYLNKYNSISYYLHNHPEQISSEVVGNLLVEYLHLPPNYLHYSMKAR